MRIAKLSVLIGGLLLGAALGLAMAGTCAADELPRKADWQMRLASDTAAGGIRIVSIVADSPGARAGLRVGDRIVSIDSQPVASSADIARHRHRSIGGAAIEFVVERDGRRISARMVPSARARESYQDLDVRYLAAKTDAGFAVSMIVTRPRDAGRSPAIVFVPWLSCDGIDYPRGAVDGWSRLLLELAHTSGMALVRVEKAGLGDSTGPACVDADLDADMAGYRAALREVARLPDIDSSRIVLFGGSIGAALAPVLAREFPVRAIVASGGFYKTWLEHMLELERRRLGFEGATPAQIGKALRGYADFYSMYLNGAMTPAQVTARRPDLASLWYDEPAHQYGRPARYYQQVQALDVAGAWSEVRVPVLILHGEYDWIMSRDDQDLIVATVNRQRAGLARLVLVPQMDHNLQRYDSPLRAYREEGGRPVDGIAQEIVRFARSVLAALPDK